MRDFYADVTFVSHVIGTILSCKSTTDSV